MRCLSLTLRDRAQPREAAARCAATIVVTTSATLSGQSLRAIAQTLGITYETVRSALKSVFHKTGAQRQSELVAMLAHAAL